MFAPARDSVEARAGVQVEGPDRRPTLLHVHAERRIEGASFVDRAEILPRRGIGRAQPLTDGAHAAVHAEQRREPGVAEPVLPGPELEPAPARPPADVD